jgi:hypothetical protein
MTTEQVRLRFLVLRAFSRKRHSRWIMLFVCISPHSTRCLPIQMDKSVSADHLKWRDDDSILRAFCCRYSCPVGSVRSLPHVSLHEPSLQHHHVASMTRPFCTSTARSAPYPAQKYTLPVQSAEGQGVWLMRLPASWVQVYRSSSLHTASRGRLHDCVLESIYLSTFHQQDSLHLMHARERTRL